MQDLHEDPPSFSVHCFGYHFVFLGMPRAPHTRSVWTQYTPTIGADASGDNQAGSTSGPIRVKSRQFRKTIGLLFKPQVHAAHDDPVGQR
jgi:hypothetical protein